MMVSYDIGLSVDRLPLQGYQVSVTMTFDEIDNDNVVLLSLDDAIVFRNLLTKQIELAHELRAIPTST